MQTMPVARVVDAMAKAYRATDVCPPVPPTASLLLLSFLVLVLFLAPKPSSSDSQANA